MSAPGSQMKVSNEENQDADDDDFALSPSSLEGFILRSNGWYRHSSISYGQIGFKKVYDSMLSFIMNNDEFLAKLDETIGSKCKFFENLHLHQIMGNIPDQNQEDESAHINAKQLTELEVMGIIAVLQDAVNKLQILSYTYQKPYVKPELVYKSLKERFGVKHESEVLIDRETDQPIETVENTMKLRKLQLDRSFLEEVLIQTIEELQTDGTFFILARIVLQEMVMNAEEKLLIEEEKKNREAVQHLRKQVLGLKKKMMEDLDECEGNIAKLRDKMQDFMFRASAETKFIEKWEFSRMEQNDMALSKKENDLHKALTNNQIGIDIEIRVHNEIEAFLKAAEEKLTNDIEAWSIKYEEDVTHLDDMIIVLNDKKQKQLEELETIMDLYNARQVEIQEFLEYKEAKRLKEEEEELRIKMAIRIQAWWRGTMVRRGLGPYRKKKKDKKGSAKKGKKKKK